MQYLNKMNKENLIEVDSQEGIDEWLEKHVGYGNWCEWWPVAPIHFGRTFSFKDPKHATMFILWWK